MPTPHCRVTLFVTCLLASICSAQNADSKRPWKGSAILGNGHLTAVYSDDKRITALTHGSGIQHLYFRDYTADYVASTTFRLPNPTSIGMKNFFTAQTQTASGTVRCFVHPDDAVVLSLNSTNASFQFQALLNKTVSSLRASNDVAVAVWSNGTVLALASKSAHGNVTVHDATVSITGSESNAAILLILANSEFEALAKVRLFRQKKDLESEAAAHWNSWINAGRLPVFKSGGEPYLEAYKRNLYCVKSANLNGQIPADITGQFLTNGMPQLYPRDAMMCARVFLLTGHFEEAKQVIRFWAKPQVPRKTPGEWYARYDAHGKAVDGGSGARFDEPEWDANGYFIYLADEYHRSQGAWLADAAFLYELADFLVAHISSNGLLQEGGIVEWTGYLPATNMICSAALTRASRIAHDFGDRKKSDAYAAAARKISAALPQMFDPTRQTYGDVRFTGLKGANGESLSVRTGTKLYLWDTTANVGVIWGFPNHREIAQSNVFYAKTTVKQGGGMQYFDSPEPGLASYGHGAFFFTTAAASQYESLYGKKSAAKNFIDWMLRNANSYGLMPEHILPDGSDISPASPLSWCGAEFAAALLLWSQP